MTEENPIPEEATMGEEKVVDKRAATLEVQEKEKGIENLKNVFGFTDEEIGVIQEVSSTLTDDLLKTANERVGYVGEGASLTTKYEVLKAKLDSLGLYNLPRQAGGAIGANRDKMLAKEGKTMADLLKEDIARKK